MNLHDAIFPPGTVPGEGKWEYSLHCSTELAKLLKRGQVYVEQSGTYIKLSCEGMETHAGGRLLNFNWEGTKLKLTGKPFQGIRHQFSLGHAFVNGKRGSGHFTSATWTGKFFPNPSKGAFELQVQGAAPATRARTVAAASEVNPNERGNDPAATSNKPVPPKESRPRIVFRRPALTQAQEQLKLPPKDKGERSGSNVPPTQGAGCVSEADEKEHKASIKEEFARGGLVSQPSGSTHASSSAKPATSSKQAAMIALVAKATEAEEKMAASEANNLRLQQILAQQVDRIRLLQEALDKCQQELREAKDALQKERQQLHSTTQESQELQDKTSTLLDAIRAPKVAKTGVDVNKQVLQDENRTQHDEIQELLFKTKSVGAKTSLWGEMERLCEEDDTTISLLRDENSDLKLQIAHLQKQLETLRASDERRKQECNRREQELKLHGSELVKSALQLSGQCQEFLEVAIPNDQEEEEEDDDDVVDDDDDDYHYDEQEVDQRRKFHAGSTPRTSSFFGPTP